MTSPKRSKKPKTAKHVLKKLFPKAVVDHVHRHIDNLNQPKHKKRVA
jgi:hypothetical protein